MKKLMFVSRLFVAMMLMATSGTVAADVCIHVPDDLTFDMCVQYQNNYYSATFRYSPVQNLPDGAFYWKLDAATLKPVTDTGYCFPAADNLDMNICGEYHETEYEFAFRYAPAGTDSESLLYWKMDSGSFQQRAGANQDTVYNYAKDIIRGYREGNLNLMMERASKMYLYDGSDYNCDYQTSEFISDTYDYPSYSYVINSVSYQNRDGKQIAEINRTTSGTEVSKNDPTQKSDFNYTGNITLIFEDDKWKVYGNQKAYPGPSASEITICESVDSDTLKPVGIRNIFTSADNEVIIFVELDGIHNGSVAYSKWYKPDGSLYAEDTHYTYNWGDYPKCDAASAYYLSYYTIRGYETSWTEGVYRIEVYADDVKVGETTFEYRP